ncbi:MAG: diguanylate cyclase [Thiotrichales bacterium]|nr:diguanylate cyclase [Thiotrichales bacterium]
MSLISFGGVIAFVVYTFHTLEQSSKNNLKERINIALEVEQLRLEHLLLEYSFWDEAHDRLIKTAKEDIDIEWLKSNIGQFLFDEYSVDMILVGSSPTQIKLGYANGRASEYDQTQLFNHGLANLINQSAQGIKLPMQILKYNNQFYMVALNEFWVEESEQPVGDGSFILFGRMVSEAFLESLSDLYKLPSLQKIDELEGVDALDYLSLKTLHSEDAFYLSWPSLTLIEYKRGILIFVLLMGVLQFLFVVYIFKKQAKDQLNQQNDLKELASKDYLTGILNRRAFIEKASAEMEASQFTKMGFCLMMLDLDDFKAINDTFGHHVGDVVLQRVTQTVEEVIREQDLFGRFGGEEFILLLPNCSLDYSKEVAERILRQIESIDVDDVTEGLQTLTVSIGLSHFQKNSELDNLIAKADQAMYLAKTSGKNQFVMI